MVSAIAESIEMVMVMVLVVLVLGSSSSSSSICSGSGTCYLLLNWFRHFHQLLYGSFRTCFSMYLLIKNECFEL